MRFARFLVLLLGFAFLYGPILILAAMSFNASKLVTVWGGFSTKWYVALLDDAAMLNAAKISLSVAALSAAIATLLGLAAAVALARFGGFRTRGLFLGAVYAPLVLPEVVLGLALLSAFVAFGFERGFVTLVIAHATFTMCFTSVVLLAALRGLRSVARGSGDGSRRDADAGLHAGRAAGDSAVARQRLSAGLHALARRSRDRQFHHGTRGDDAADADLFASAARRDARGQCDLDAFAGLRRAHSRHFGAGAKPARARGSLALLKPPRRSTSYISCPSRRGRGHCVRAARP